jgi:hypothetical protein
MCASFVIDILPPKFQRAQGMPGARRARSLACKSRKHASKSPRSRRLTRHSPRNGFNGFLRALPGDRACLPPSSPRSLLLKNLTPASGRQDHTTSPSASSAFVNAPSASTASRLTSVTIAKRPSVEAGWQGFRFDLGRRRSGIFLQMGLDWWNQFDPLQQIRFFETLVPGPHRAALPCQETANVPAAAKNSPHLFRRSEFLGGRST